MTLQQLKYLVEVYNTGSITSAAQRLYIGQPSLSKSLRELEKDVGVTLFDRSRCGVSFTPEGMELLAYARTMLEYDANIRSHFDRRKKGEPVRLSISAHHYIFAVDALIDYINEEMTNTSEFALTIRECRTSQIIQDVLTHNSDIGIMYTSSIIGENMESILERNNIEFHPLARFGSHVYLRSGHPLAFRKTVTLKDLEPYPCIRYEQPGDSLIFSEESAVNSETDRNIFVTDRSTLLSIICGTDAYNIGSGCIMQNIINRDLVTVPLAEHDSWMEIGWIKMKDIKFSDHIQAYVDRMIRSMGKILQDRPMLDKKNQVH